MAHHCQASLSPEQLPPQLPQAPPFQSSVCEGGTKKGWFLIVCMYVVHSKLQVWGAVLPSTSSSTFQFELCKVHSHNVLDALVAFSFQYTVPRGIYFSHTASIFPSNFRGCTLTALLMLLLCVAFCLSVWCLLFLFSCTGPHPWLLARAARAAHSWLPTQLRNLYGAASQL